MIKELITGFCISTLFPWPTQLRRTRTGVLSPFAVIGVLILLQVGSTAAQANPLTIGADLLPEGEVNVAYNSDLAISGGAPPYTVILLKGSLPMGLGIDNTGAITGTPTPLAKSVSFTVKATDSFGSSVGKQFKIKIFKALDITTPSLKAVKEGRKYAAALKATGGKKPYGWSILSGDLPSGLTFDSATGKIQGIPTEVGRFDLTFQVSDPLGGESQKAFSLLVDLAVECAPAPPGSGIVEFSDKVRWVWYKIPLITLSGKQGDPGINFGFEAVNCWNMRLAEIGTTFRFGPVVHSTEIVPEDFLVRLSEAGVNGQPLPDLPESVMNMEGDIIVALSDADLISLTAHYPSKVLIAIRGEQLSPLTLPNVTRNIIAHELGHAIALSHNDDRTRLMCGRPAECRPDAFESQTPRFFPLTVEEEDMLLEAYPPGWLPIP
jgi:hypothetical protein